MTDLAPVMESEETDRIQADRARTGVILEAIGGAANDVLIGGPDPAEDPVGRQLRRDLARIGALLVYASMVREPASVNEQNLSAIMKFGRQLRVRLDRM